ncbi:MAG: hypothetical protein ABW168_29365 [Sedimenticola sp.]
MLRLVLVCFVIFLLPACYSKSEYEDVSSHMQYSRLIGNRFETLAPLVVHGVTLDQNYKKVIEVFVVTVEPGFGGPEVLMRRDLPVGSIVSIEKVLRCSTCLPSYIEYEINFLSENIGSDIPVRLDDLSIKNNKGSLILNPDVFRKLNN